MDIRDRKYFNSPIRYLIGILCAWVGYCLFQGFIVKDPYFAGYEVPVTLIGSYVFAKIVIIMWKNLLLRKTNSDDNPSDKNQNK